jgi:hypothetical protein
VHSAAWRPERVKNANKGQIRIIEAFFAVIIIFSAFAVSANLSVSNHTISHENLASIGLNSLVELDRDGYFCKYITTGNFTALREALSLVLPTGVCFNLTIYDTQMQQVNTEIITNSGFGTQDIATVEYVSAGQDSPFLCYIVHMQLWVVT